MLSELSDAPTEDSQCREDAITVRKGYNMMIINGDLVSERHIAECSKKH